MGDELLSTCRVSRTAILHKKEHKKRAQFWEHMHKYILNTAGVSFNKLLTSLTTFCGTHSIAGIIHESLRQTKMFHFSPWIPFSPKTRHSGGGRNHFSVVAYLPARTTYNQNSITLDMSFCPYTEKAERSGLPIFLPSGRSAVWSFPSGRQCVSMDKEQDWKIPYVSSCVFSDIKLILNWHRML